MLKTIQKKLRILKYHFLDLTGRKKNQHHYETDYQPVLGYRSKKAERLVDYCLGDNKDRPILPCTKKRHYLSNKFILLLQTGSRQAIISAGNEISSEKTSSEYDTKKVVEAMINQHVAIPNGLNCWISRGDNAGRASDPSQGLHITGMRPFTRRDLVLVPTECRDRFLGPNLKHQLEELRQSWVPWEEKSDTVWWGGALTGSGWEKREPRTLTRREVLCHFQKHPSAQVSLHMTELPKKGKMPPDIKLEGRFTKQSAYRHKCLLLLPGNDIASGSSWYFAGNSVVLMPEPHMEHILYFEMEPWIHYVPLENDPADILIKLQWVLGNPEKSKKIVANSHERLRWLCGPEYLWACNEVLRRIV